MGINQLTNLIRKEAPAAIQQKEIISYRGQKIAIDATIAIYQWQSVGQMRNIKNKQHKYINHLQGMFFRSINLLSKGILPLYVFDGPPPAIKTRALMRRNENPLRIRIDPNMITDCKRLLAIMGLRYVEAPSEAEAECADLAKAQRVSGVATEDMDALVFGAPILLRNLGVDRVVSEINLNEVLKGFRIGFRSFIDLCILLGSDYCGKIPGIGPAKALELIRKHKTIERIIAAESINISKLDFDYQAARIAFRSPTVLPRDRVKSSKLIWRPLEQQQVNALYQFLVVENQLDEKKVISGIAKLETAERVPMTSK